MPCSCMPADGRCAQGKLPGRVVGGGGGGGEEAAKIGGGLTWLPPAAMPSAASGARLRGTVDTVDRRGSVARTSPTPGRPAACRALG